LQGKTLEEAHQELIDQGYSTKEARSLAQHKMMPGNRPSHTFVMEKLTPQSLGALIALYEHRAFVHGVIWNINSFDQWGVEYGKVLAGQIQQDLAQPGDVEHHDSSTNGLINYRKYFYFNDISKKTD
jgi:glucose-6-phosphate isomerase